MPEHVENHCSKHAKSARPLSERPWDYMPRASLIREFLEKMGRGRHVAIANSEFEVGPTFAVVLKKVTSYDPDLYNRSRKFSAPFRLVAVLDGDVPNGINHIPAYSIHVSTEYIELVCRSIDNLFIPITWARVDTEELAAGIIEKVVKYK